MDVKENWMPLALAALLGTSGGGGVSTFISNQHTHPEIMVEIRKVQYESIVERAKVVMAATTDHTEADYLVAQAQLIKYTEKLADLE